MQRECRGCRGFCSLACDVEAVAIFQEMQDPIEEANGWQMLAEIHAAEGVAFTLKEQLCHALRTLRRLPNA